MQTDPETIAALVNRLRKAADWGEDDFDVLSPQDASQAADMIEALTAAGEKLAAFASIRERHAVYAKQALIEWKEMTR